MKTLSVIALVFILTFGRAWSQVGPNIITNPSFEAYTVVPAVRPDFVGYVQTWFPTSTCCYTIPAQSDGGSPCSNVGLVVCETPDYFHALCINDCTTFPGTAHVKTPDNCMGTEAPHHGQAYAGLICSKDFTAANDGCGPRHWTQQYNAELISVPLTNPMIVGRTYNVGFWVSLAEISQYAVNNLGFVLSPGNPTFASCDRTSSQATLIAGGQQYAHPQVIANKNGWVRISAKIVAALAHNYITIGRIGGNVETNLGIGTYYCGTNPNGRPFAPYAYYYVDAAYATEQLCNCENLTVELPSTDADPHCCRYFKIGAPGNGNLGTNCTTLGMPGSITSIRVTSCTPGITVQQKLRFPPGSPGSNDRYHLEGDTYVYDGGLIPNSTDFEDLHPGILCFLDADGNPFPCPPANRNICLTFQFLDANGDIICDKVLNTQLSCCGAD